ncbi:MAG: hypothetical protein Pyrs2KO_14870 [Pyruvatibacter sp.]
MDCPVKPDNGVCFSYFILPPSHGLTGGSMRTVPKTKLIPAPQTTRILKAASRLNRVRCAAGQSPAGGVGCVAMAV